MNDSEFPKPPREESKHRFWDKFKLGPSRSEPNPTVDPTQRATSDEEQIAALNASLLESDDSPLPEWADREIDLDSINLRALPINWQALTGLGTAINAMKDDSFEKSDLTDIKPPPEVYPALPMIASVIAHKRNPVIPVVLPTQAEVKAMKPWLVTMERFIGRFSQDWARKFGGYVEKRGQQVMADMGTRISTVAEQAETIENPKHQFVREIASLYNHISQSEYRTVEGLFGDHQEQIAIEDKICDLLSDLRRVRNGNDHKIYSKEQYPLLSAVLPLIKFPPDTLDFSQASTAGAELMEGIHTFLRQQGIKGLRPVPKAREVDLFDPGSWMRGFAEIFADEKLERVKRGLPNVLTYVLGILPSNGPHLSGQIYTIAENMSVLRAQGISPEEIANHAFAK